MNVVLVSNFRNMSGRVARYLDQVLALSQHHKLRVVAIEGDSIDDTAGELVRLSGAMGIPLTIHTHNHGKQVFGSTESSERFVALTGVMMAGMHAVNSSDEVAVSVESDLMWGTYDMLALIGIVHRGKDTDIVAPMIFAGARFYDVWAFRKNGIRFTPHAPYHHELAINGVTEVDSVGSCLAMRAEIAQTVTPIGQQCIVSWCAGARAQGYTIGVAAGLRVAHP